MVEQRPWLKNYPGGVPANIDTNQFKTVVEMVEMAFERYPNNIAFSCMGKSLTYRQVEQKIAVFRRIFTIPRIRTRR